MATATQDSLDSGVKAANSAKEKAANLLEKVREASLAVKVARSLEEKVLNPLELPKLENQAEEVNRENRAAIDIRPQKMGFR